MKRFFSFGVLILAGGMSATLAAWMLFRTPAIGQETTKGKATQRQAVARQQAAGVVNANQRVVQASPSELYSRLSTRKIQPNFQKVTIHEALRKLSAALDAPIELDSAAFDPDALPREYTWAMGEPVSVKYALERVLSGTGLSSLVFTLNENRVRIIRYNAESQDYILKSLDLRGASDYTTKYRLGAIEDIQQSITPDEWNRPQGPWIVPGTSVFTIDVYHRPAEQVAIREHWGQSLRQRQYGNWRHVPTESLPEDPAPQEMMNKIVELRQQFPFESLAGRLDYETGKAGAEVPLAREVQQRLNERDEPPKDAFDRRMRSFYDVRVGALERLHGNEVARFISREGQGRSRMIQPEPSHLPLPRLPSLALPSVEIDPPLQAEQPARLPREAAESVSLGSPPFPTLAHLRDLYGQHTDAFVSPSRLGYVKDRDHVAGFGGHAISYNPRRLEDVPPTRDEPTEQWAIRRMELVSLLKHPTPRVYASSSVPRMEELAEAPTRALGHFESAALKKLQAEEDIVVRATTNRIEMLGALRASQQCLECHRVARGQLLGAFSYTLVRDPLLAE